MGLSTKGLAATLVAMVITGLPSTSRGMQADLGVVSAGVEQVARDVVQFWMDLREEPPVYSDRNKWTTCIWFVDTDCNGHTGQSHGPVGSEYNVRAVLRNDPRHGGGFVDVVDGQSCSVPIFVDGKRVIARVSLAQLGSPRRFRWNCGASSSEGGSGYRPDATTFEVSENAVTRGRPARVVIEPYVMLAHGVMVSVPEVRAFAAGGQKLSIGARAVKFWAYSGPAKVRSRQIEAVPNSAGLAKATAMVDGVVSFNVARVMVGCIEVVPGAVHLETSRRPQAQVGVRVWDAQDQPIALEGHDVVFHNHDDTVATLSVGGVVRALPTGAGKYTCVGGEFDGMPASNHCCVRVLGFPAPLLPEREERGRFVSFWYPPLNIDPSPAGCRFDEVVAVYHYVPTLDQLYLQIHDLTGAVPQGAWRLTVSAICEDDAFHLCGLAGQNINVMLGFDPRKPSSCVQLPDGTPHWGVVSHEMGHLFIFELPALNSILCDHKLGTGTAYGEGLASLCGIWARAAVVERPDHCGVAPIVLRSFTDPTVYDSLPWARRVLVEERLTGYLRNGARYPTDFTADVLDGMLFVLAERYGWGVYRRFFSIFYPTDEPLDFSPRTEQQRATFLAAALSAATRADLRPVFDRWGLPRDDALFRKLLPQLSVRASQRD